VEGYCQRRKRATFTTARLPNQPETSMGFVEDVENKNEDPNRYLAMLYAPDGFVLTWADIVVVDLVSPSPLQAREDGSC
jgi:hypothetical protein